MDRINAALNTALQQPEMNKYLEQQGMIPAGGTPQQFQQRIRREYDRWTKLVAEAHLKPQ
jgi:tripartite-type tricarboxylate transporter receptor subunit TctC